jgi:hypothetical protein
MYVNTKLKCHAKYFNLRFIDNYKHFTTGVVFNNFISDNFTLEY